MKPLLVALAACTTLALASDTLAPLGNAVTGPSNLALIRPHQASPIRAKKPLSARL
jgi:hypothetical protein